MEARSLLRRAGWLVRARRGLALAGGCALGLLAVGTGLRLFGGGLPPLAWTATVAGFLIGLVLPRPKEKALLWAGRRLGVGARLAALELLHSRGEAALAGRLQRELGGIRPRWWGIFTGRCDVAGILALAAGLALFFLLPPLSLAPRPASLLPAAQEQAAQAEPEPQEPEPPNLAEPARLALPQATSSGLPFQDLLAEVYGLSQGEGALAAGEGLESGIQAQRELLRELAQELARLAPQGLSPEEQRTLVPMIQELARRDLRERLLHLIGEGDEESAREAAQAVEAVRRAGEALAQAAQGGGEAAQGPGEEGGAPLLAMGEEGPPAPGEQPAPAGEEPVEEEGALAGLAPGEPSTGEAAPAPEAPAQDVAVEVRPAEGAARGYLAAGVPVEPEGAPPTGSPIFSPGEVELILRGRGVPPELRGVVRRYFEILSQGGDQ